MRIVTICIPGRGDFPSDIIAKAVLELAAYCKVGEVKVNTWDTEESTNTIVDENTVEIDSSLMKSVEIVTQASGINGQETMGKLLAIMQSGTTEAELVKNAVTVLLEYSKPQRLCSAPFNLKGYIYSAICNLKKYNLV